MNAYKERLSVVDDTKKTDAKRRNKLQELHRIKKCPIKITSQKKGQDNTTKSHPKLKGHQDDQPAFPQNE